MDTYLIIKSILPFCSLGCKALQARESSVPGQSLCGYAYVNAHNLTEQPIARESADTVFKLDK